MQYIKTISLLLFILFCGCKDEFLLESYSNKPILVVDGSITNEEGPYTIKVSQASSLNEKGEIPFQDCIVTIYDNKGQTETLIETEPGIYNTLVGGFQGIIGNEYRLSISTPEGKEYETNYQIMKEPVGIESFNADLTNLDHVDYPFGLPGYQFYMSTENATNQESYFLWKLTETYEYVNDYKLDHFFLGLQTVQIDSVTTGFEEITNDTLLDYFNIRLFTCWKTQDVNYIFTGQTKNLTIPKITNQPLNFVSTESKKLSIRYSLLLKQFSINKEAHIYWDAIEKQSSEENFIVVSQPYSIAGNIFNSEDPSELVFGYFTVASVTEKRIFIDRPSKPFYFNICNVTTDPVSIREITLHQDPPFYYVQTDYGMGLIDEECLDCRTKGGKNTKPGFWIDF